MKFRIFAIFILMLSLSFSLSKACFRSTRTELTQIQGFELEDYIDINSYQKGDLSRSMLAHGLYFDDYLVYTRYSGDIEVEIFIIEKRIFPMRIIHKKISNIFNFASEHLQEHFSGLFVNKKLFLRILACCIEYGMRRGNTLFIELRENINCVTKLGLDGSQTDSSWISTRWEHKDVFEILL